MLPTLCIVIKMGRLGCRGSKFISPPLIKTKDLKQVLGCQVNISLQSFLPVLLPPSLFSFNTNLTLNTRNLFP